MAYQHLSRKERGKLAMLAQNGISVREISRQLKRSASTISRELKRLDGEGRYYRADRAQAQYILRRERCCRKCLYENKRLSEYIQTALQSCWSPEQVSGRLPLDYPNDHAMRVSFPSIYRWLHKGLISQAAELKLMLRRHGHQHGDKRGQ